MKYLLLILSVALFIFFTFQGCTTKQAMPLLDKQQAKAPKTTPTPSQESNGQKAQNTTEEFDDEFEEEFEAKEDQFKQLEDKEIVKMMLSKLSDKHREVVILYYLLDFKISEIANSLHINEGTVKSRLYTAKDQLKSLTNKWGVEYETT